MGSRYLILCLFSLCLIFACTKDSTDDPMDPNTGGDPNSMMCDTDGITFSAVVQPLLSANCATSGCHNSATMQSGLDLATYNSAKVIADDGRLTGVINHASGFPSMPRNASKLAQCTIDRIQSWINAGAMDN